MADETVLPETNDVVSEAQKLAQLAYDHWNEIYEKARSDLRMLSDDDGAQWDAKAYSARIDTGRPALTIDQLSQFVNQVSNNVRMNTPSINIIPSDGVATKEIAEIIKGRIKEIEYQSRADDAYDNAVNSAIKCSIGYIRIDHDWKDSYSFDQTINIKRVVNPFSILLDPNSIEPDGSDAMYSFVLDTIPVSDFNRDYPGKSAVSFCYDGSAEDKKRESQDVVTIAEYFKVELTQITLGLLPDGSAEEVKPGVQYLRTRTGQKRTVKRCLLSGMDILQEGMFPGEYLPTIPVYGEEAWQGSERKLNSLIRKAKDSQRLYNYWKTMEAEMLQRAPKAIAIAPGGTTEDYADDWKYPEKAAVLRYTPKQAPNGQFLPPPSLTSPPPIPSGYVNASQSASQDIKATMGLYNAFLGQTSNETSGVAIQARKVEGDRAVYHFGDNLVRSITQVGRVLVSMLPVIDDTPKVVSIIGDDGEQKLVGINGALVEGQEQSYDLSLGQYSVKVTTGSSLPTLRQEFALVMQGMLEKNPELLRVMGDVFMENQDFPGAQAVAKRLKIMLLPEVKQAMSDDNQDPETIALTQENQQLKGVMQQMQAELQSKQSELELKQQEIAIKAQGEQSDNAIELKRLQLEEARLIFEIETNRQDMALKERELALKEAEALVAAQRNTAPVYGEPGEVPAGEGALDD